VIKLEIFAWWEEMATQAVTVSLSNKRKCHLSPISAVCFTHMLELLQKKRKPNAPNMCSKAYLLAIFYIAIIYCQTPVNYLL
jgi:hypothetical protein